MKLERLVPQAFVGLLAQATVFAQDDVTVFSARADSVAVTIYPDDLALITETRTVELPASAATLVIQDVADTLLPQSAVVNGLDRPLAESNFDFNRLSPQTLITQAVGQAVTLMRTNPATGVVTRMPATLVAAGEGVVLETADGNEALYCAGLPEGLAFDAIPDDLYAAPRLSVRLADGAPGEQTIRVSYLAHGFEWSADYVARLESQAESMDLIGWATVRNSSSKVFDQAELQLIAGRLNVLSSEEGGSRAEEVPAARGEPQVDARARIAEQGAVRDAVLLRECFEAELPAPGQSFSISGPLFETVIVTGARIPPREEFGDYHLYRLPWRTDLGARQTKQVRFLEQDDVAVERFYRLYVFDIDYPSVLGGLRLLADGPGGPGTFAIPPIIMFRTENTLGAGLGEPLPAGYVRIFEAYGGGSVFVGQSFFGDRPVGAEIELETGRALDVVAQVSFRVEEGDRLRVGADYQVINDKTLPIDLEILHTSFDNVADLTVEESSRSYELGGDRVSWRFTVSPGTETLSYRLSGTEP